MRMVLVERAKADLDRLNTLRRKDELTDAETVEWSRLEMRFAPLEHYAWRSPRLHLLYWRLAWRSLESESSRSLRA